MNAPADTCPRCTAALRHRGTHSYCPRCLVHTALSAPAATSPGGRTAPAIEDIAALFPGYEIVQLLGAGGMGLVYEARQQKLDRLVALKLLPDDDAALNPEFAERFTREARSLARLNHPDIVQVYDQGQVPGWYFIVMEFVDGPDLARVLKRDGPIPPARALAMFGRLCESLAEAHRLGIVHRDLKPANLLLDGGRVLKVADFGLAKLLDRPEGDFTLTNDEAALGTPYYMAPEQRAGSGDIDQRTDIYSLGVLLYEMLTGELPTGNFKPPSQLAAVSPAIDRVVLKAMASNPADRFRDLDELRAALAKAARRRPPRSLVLLSVVAGLALAGVVAAALIGANNRTANSAETPQPEATQRSFDWSQAITLTSPQPGEQGYFGQYGDVVGDLYAVSAPGAGVIEPEVAEEVDGKVYLYRLQDSSPPSLLATLQAPSPRPGDRFGFPLDLSDDGRTLAVFGEVRDGDRPNSAIYIFEPEDGERTDWRLHQTLSFEHEFGGLDTKVRMVVSGEWMAVSSPDAPPTEAVRLYRRSGEGWVQHSRLAAGEALNDDCHFGFLCKFHEGELYVSAYRAGSGTSHRSGALFIFAPNEAGEWRQVQKLSHPSGSMFGYFGLDWAFPAEDRLAVGSFGDSSGGALVGGAVVLFARDESTGRWEFVQKFSSPESSVGRAFGQQLIGDGEGLLTVLSAEGSRSEGTLRSVAHVFAISPDPARPLNCVMRFRPETNETWLGRPLFGQGHLFLAAPNTGGGEVEAVGRVYLVPKNLLPKQP